MITLHPHRHSAWELAIIAAKRRLDLERRRGDPLQIELAEATLNNLLDQKSEES